MKKYASMRERLIANSASFSDDICWLWLGKSSRSRGRDSRYGRLNVRVLGRHVTLLAHRVSYETFHGPIPDGHEVDHTCYETMCINPAHLEVVPPTVNKSRIRSKVRRGARYEFVTENAPTVGTGSDSVQFA